MISDKPEAAEGVTGCRRSSRENRVDECLLVRVDPLIVSVEIDGMHFSFY
jgi:hypothetical protein